MNHTNLFYKIHAISKLTGSKHFSINSHLKDIYNNLELILNNKNNNNNTNNFINKEYNYGENYEDCLSYDINHLMYRPNNFLINNKFNDNLTSIVNFSSMVYSIRPMSMKCQIELIRTGNLDACISIILNTIDGSMLANEDFKAMNNYEIIFKPGESSIKISLLISAQMSSQIGNNFFIYLSLHENSFNLACLGLINYCMVMVNGDQHENSK
jgi:hypothetical protein